MLEYKAIKKGMMNMLKKEELLELLIGLLVEDFDHSFVYGHGIITEQQVAFDQELLEKNKHIIANFLRELGIDELSSITLERLTKLKNGETWNVLQTKEDFETLEYLLACSDACGFINNGISTINKNIFELGDISVILTSDFGDRLNQIDNQWLQVMREGIIKRMHFPTRIDKIKEYASSGDNLANKSLAKINENI